MQSIGLLDVNNWFTVKGNLSDFRMYFGEILVRDGLTNISNTYVF